MGDPGIGRSEGYMDRAGVGERGANRMELVSIGYEDEMLTVCD